MNSKVHFPNELKYLIPKNNSWAKRLCLLFCFIFLDYFVTLVFCSTPAQEANVRARGFMEVYGIPLGLTMFNVLMSTPIYLTLSLDSHFVRLSGPWSKIVEFFVDVIFAWFIAAPHFNGAASWFWQAPEMLCRTLGASIYLIVAFALVEPHVSQEQTVYVCSE
ncbi:MAG: hypothetical protein U9O89_06755 [Thermoproteota archaeon]|nr:hypothetical protein [Thermoproteota archaeon]